MRAMMVTTQGEDYVIFAEAKGLQGPDHLPPLRHPQRAAAAGDGAGAGRSGNWSPARCWSK